ncbi:DUF2750 domain-containing protein [Terrabacter sp. 2YAF2]|uniref:DUF2750 domain-containing protein n=1 Tax=Terrabacter sp. 2YAF2 TaxID=3233026 RepID=UPI003F9BB3E1
MSTADLHAAAFFKESVDRETVWLLVTDDESGVGYARAATPSGEVALGVWSTERRARKVASTVPEYAPYRPHPVPLEELLTDWVPELDASNTNVGLNWSGPSAQGARVTTSALVRGVRARQWELGASARAARRAAEWGE